MKKLFFIMLLILGSFSVKSQSKKQIKEAFTRPISVKSMVFYCQSFEQYERKRDRVLNLLDRMGIEYAFKVSYKYSRFYHFKINYKDE